MARLAIRVTGDRSKRENVTTGDNVVHVTLIRDNKQVQHIMFTHSGIYATRKDGTATLLDTVEEKSETHSA